MQPIQGLGSIGNVVAPSVGRAEAGGAGGASFQDVLASSIAEVNQLQHEAQSAVEGLATGAATSEAEVLVAVQKADLAFRMLMQIRNKVVAAYDEVRQMRV